MVRKGNASQSSYKFKHDLEKKLHKRPTYTKDNVLRHLSEKHKDSLLRY